MTAHVNNQRVCVWKCVYPSARLCQSVWFWLFDSGKAIFWNSNPSPVIYERKKWRGGYMRRENINQHARTPTHTQTHRVVLETHTNLMLLTLFMILVRLQWKWTAACISLMNLKTWRHVYATWMKCNTCMLTHCKHKVFRSFYSNLECETCFI